MTHQEAKEILLRHRAQTADDREPEVKTAREVARHDPSLAAWVRDHEEFQAGVRTRLRDLPIPEGLKEQIISERPAAVGPRRVSLRRAMFAGAVSGVVFALGLALVLLRPWAPDREDRFETFRSRMVRAALRGYAMDLTTSDPGQVRQFLAAKQAFGEWEVPAGLRAARLLGCAMLGWHDAPAAMICYGQNSEPDLWLFVVDASDLPDPPRGREVLLAKVNRLNTASWTAQGKTYVLAGDLSDTRLRELIGGSPAGAAPGFAQ